MPCNCDYLEPTEREVKVRRICQLIEYVNQKLGLSTYPQIIKGNSDIYGNGLTVNMVGPMLCNLIQNMNETQKKMLLCITQEIKIAEI